MAIELTKEAVNAAKALLDHPVVNEIFEELERDAIEAALNAGPLEHEIRLALLNEAKVIRAVRSKLHTLTLRGAALS